LLPFGRDYRPVCHSIYGITNPIYGFSSDFHVLCYTENHHGVNDAYSSRQQRPYHFNIVEWIGFCFVHPSSFPATPQIPPGCVSISQNDDCPCLIRWIYEHGLWWLLSAVRAAGVANRTKWVDCPANIPLLGTTLPTKLPLTLHCRRPKVPMDYTKPMAGNNSITLGFSMYRRANPQGLVSL